MQFLVKLKTFCNPTYIKELIKSYCLFFVVKNAPFFSIVFVFGCRVANMGGEERGERERERERERLGF